MTAHREQRSDRERAADEESQGLLRSSERLDQLRDVLVHTEIPHASDSSVACARARRGYCWRYGRNMSLTRHLKNVDSPVHEFVYSSAPELATAGTRGAVGKANATRFDFDALTELETQIPIPADVKPSQRKSHAVVAGTALDYRLRMDLPGFDVGETTAWKGLERLRANPDVIHRGKHIAALLQDALNFGYLALKEKDPHPLSLARLSIPLAWCEAVYRAGPVTALTNDLGRRIKRAKDAVELVMGIDEDLLVETREMVRDIRPCQGQRLRQPGRVPGGFEKLQENPGAGRIGHRTAETVHHINTRRKGQHPLTIHLILFDRSSFPIS